MNLYFPQSTQATSQSSNAELDIFGNNNFSSQALGTQMFLPTENTHANVTSKKNN